MRWVLVGIIEGSVDHLSQVVDTVEHTPANPFISNFSEPTLDQIQPRTGSGNTVQMEPRMAGEQPFEPGNIVHRAEGCTPSC